MPHPSIRFRSALLTFLPTCLLVAMLAFAARPAEAATITVCAVGCDYPTIDAAEFNATSGDTILISDTIHTDSDYISKDLTISGLGSGATILQAAGSRGSASGRVLTIAPGVTVTITNMTIRWGNELTVYGGGLYINNTATAFVDNVVITENDSNFGGGIYNAGTLTINNSYISNNTAISITGSSGGGIYNTDVGTVLTMTNSTVANNNTN
ncbi:MAG: hypothetical protein KDD89_15410, partial [Anaerolineales bacterium]|nr:hypothetical protein [Anaerolineales bacterium]